MRTEGVDANKALLLTEHQPIIGYDGFYPIFGFSHLRHLRPSPHPPVSQLLLELALAGTLEPDLSKDELVPLRADEAASFQIPRLEKEKGGDKDQSASSIFRRMLLQGDLSTSQKKYSKVAFVLSFEENISS